MSSGLFEQQTTDEQRAALERLETLLALIEGWVDLVVAEAVGERLPGADALRETLRRRRASGGPAEQTFATLVGLELRPRRLRAAAELWRVLGEKRGTSGRDTIWAHPDLLPTASDLDDPAGFAEGGDQALDPITEIERTTREEQADPDAGRAKPDAGPGEPDQGPGEPELGSDEPEQPN
jgi:putative hydrolase